ncbi:MAG: hypothetical protein LBU32_26980 [Clostridiales bacterium]|jgi:hypothetical protein|nr:hypothetical protein [Clostridiales bacterium]
MMPTETEALRAAVQAATQMDLESVKIARIKDTLHLAEIRVSESLLTLCGTKPREFSLL